MSLLTASIKQFCYDDTSPILRDIQLDIDHGELIVITGLSGCGKTTLMRILNGLIPAHFNGHLDGDVRLLGKNLLDYEKGALALHMANVFQNPSNQFFATIAEEEVAFAGENLGMDSEILRKKTSQAFECMQISDLMPKKLCELSGGQKQKVAIASTLLYDTKIIFLDEPSSNLDHAGICQLQNTLRDLRAMGKTIIITEHRLSFLHELYDRLLYMRDGTIAKVFERGKLTQTDCQKYGLRAIDYQALTADNDSELHETLEDIALTITIGKKTLIDSLAFSLKRGEVMAIIGRNGIGKTTLARTLAGLLKNKGAVSYGATPKQRLKNAYYMMQDVDYQIFFDTVENELIPKDKIKDRAYLDKVTALLKTIDLWDEKMDHPQELSGGQKQRLALVTAFLSDRRVVILDEPTSGLDFQRMYDIADMIIEYATHKPVMIITHDIELLYASCNTVLMIDEDSYTKMPVKGNEENICLFLGINR